MDYVNKLMKKTYTREELIKLKKDVLVNIASKRGLAMSGTKKEIIAEILKEQTGEKTQKASKKATVVDEVEVLDIKSTITPVSGRKG